MGCKLINVFILVDGETVELGEVTLGGGYFVCCCI